MKITEIEIRASSTGTMGNAVDDARVTARAFAQVRPFFIGREAIAHEQNATEYCWFDRRWNHSAIYAFGPFGIAGVLKVARLAEAFGLTCELHTALHHPVDDFPSGLAEPFDIRDGYACTPTTPGLGALYDWDVIDDATVEIMCISIGG